MAYRSFWTSLIRRDNALTEIKTETRRTCKANSVRAPLRRDRASWIRTSHRAVTRFNLTHTPGFDGINGHALCERDPFDFRGRGPGRDLLRARVRECGADALSRERCIRALECGAGTRRGEYTRRDQNDPACEEHEGKVSGPDRAGPPWGQSRRHGRGSGKLRAKLITGRLVGTTGVRCACLERIAGRLYARDIPGSLLHLIPRENGIGEPRVATGFLAVLSVTTASDPSFRIRKLNH